MNITTVRSHKTLSVAYVLAKNLDMNSKTLKIPVIVLSRMTFSDKC